MSSSVSVFWISAAKAWSALVEDGWSEPLQILVHQLLEGRVADEVGIAADDLAATVVSVISAAPSAIFFTRGADLAFPAGRARGSDSVRSRSPARRSAPMPPASVMA